MAADKETNPITSIEHGAEQGRDGQKPVIPTIGKVLLHVQGIADQPIEVDLSGTEGYILGRSDSKSSYMPDIDLASYQALDKGVSRRHAALIRHEGNLHVIDLSSVNGTFLNGERLAAETVTLLHLDDQLTLGELQMGFAKLK